MCSSVQKTIRYSIHFPIKLKWSCVNWYAWEKRLFYFVLREGQHVFVSKFPKGSSTDCVGTILYIMWIITLSLCDSLCTMVAKHDYLMVCHYTGDVYNQIIMYMGEAGLDLLLSPSCVLFDTWSLPCWSWILNCPEWMENCDFRKYMEHNTRSYKQPSNLNSQSAALLPTYYSSSLIITYLNHNLWLYSIYVTFQVCFNLVENTHEQLFACIPLFLPAFSCLIFTPM